MNKRIQKKHEEQDKTAEDLAKKMLHVMPKGDTIKQDKDGKVTNWNELNPQTKDWIING